MAGRSTALRGAALAAWWLLLGNLFWVLAYDTEYAMVDRDDDLKIGIKTSAITLGRFDVAAVMVFYAAYLRSGRRSAAALGLGASYLAGHRRGRGAGAVALHADPHAHARRLLPRLPAQPLARLRGLRRRGAGPGRAVAGSSPPRQAVGPPLHFARPAT